MPKASLADAGSTPPQAAWYSSSDSVKQIDRRIEAGIGPIGLGQSRADLQAIGRAGLGIAVETFQLGKLLIGQRLLGDMAERGQQFGNQPRLAGRPLALPRPPHGGQRPLDVRPGLVLDFRGAALDEQFQEVEGPAVHLGLGAVRAATMRSTIESAVASSRTSPSTPDMLLQERIDLAGRVAEDRIAQSGQEAEVARGGIELLELIEIALRLAGFFEECRKGVQDFHVQFAGRRLLAVVAPLPGLQLRRRAIG